MRASLRVRVLAAVTALAASTACGSTIQDKRQVTFGGPSQASTDGGLSLPGSTSGGSSGTTGLSGTATSGLGVPASTTGAGNGGTSGSTTGFGGGSSTTGSGTSLQGKGITATQVKIGIGYCTDCASANAALGAGGEDPGDVKRYYDAAVADANARGGVLGRKLVPVYQPFSASDDIAVSTAAACQKWTKDSTVAAMVFRAESTYQCALKAGVLAASTANDVLTGPLLQKYPNVFAPNSIRLEGLYALTVDAMVHAQWQKPSTAWPTGKIGLITWDDPQYHYAMANGYLKALHAHGLKEEDVRYIAVPADAGSIASASASVSNAVLAFQQRGIDHVFIGDGAAGIFGGVGLTLLFLQNAQSQQYFPRYGFNGNNAPDYPNHPKRELVGMRAIETIDDSKDKDAGIAVNAERERCFTVMKRAGLPVGQQQTQGVAILACEAVWFPQAALNHAGDSTLARVIPGVESLGTSYRSVFTFGTRFGQDHHDGIYLIRDVLYDDGCSCLKYTSKPYAP